MNNLNIFFNKNHEMVLNNDVSLEAITSKVVDYLNSLIDRENELLKMFENLKTETNISITDLTNALSLFVATQKSNYSSFEAEIINTLEEYKNETDTEITNKSNEVDNTLNNIDLTSAVSDYFTSQLNTDYFKNLYKNIVKSIYVLADYSSNPNITYNIAYYYNTTEDVLYYKQGRVVNAVDLIESCFYYFNGHLYVVVEENGKKVLREGVITNG
ncbi:MAG: hypothetical protein SOT41_05350 [Candidatus Faecisoma sp.]|nr:hypothetical protein [Candidatus Faecisoma sp.]